MSYQYFFHSLFFIIAGSNWQYMTITEKRIKDMKNDDMVDHTEGADASDPGAGLMNLMKKMYQSGDSDMKKVIAKAWTEAQDKRDKEGPQF
jgi:calcyclin binding protein